MMTLKLLMIPDGGWGDRSNQRDKARRRSGQNIFFCFLAILKENENWQQSTQLIAASTIFFQRHNYRIIATQDRYKNHWKLSWASLQVKYIGTVAGEFCDESQGDCTVNVDLDMVLVLSFISWSILNERISHPLVQLKSPSSSSSSLSLSSWFQSWKHNSFFFSSGRKRGVVTGNVFKHDGLHEGILNTYIGTTSHYSNFTKYHQEITEQTEAVQGSVALLQVAFF